MARAKIEDERKEQILAAFEACVIREGLAKTTLQKVADQAGLPRSLVRYFVGNRDQMVTLLIERMVDRAEAALFDPVSAKRAPGLARMLDLIFEKIFHDDTSNGVVSELWYLAARDEGIRERLQSLYTRITDLLGEAMKREGLGKDRKDRSNVAYAIVSLGYGDASFQSLNLKGGAKRGPRVLADELLKTLSPHVGKEGEVR